MPNCKVSKDQLCLLFGGNVSRDDKFKLFVFVLDVSKWCRNDTLEIDICNLGTFTQTIYSSRRLQMQAFNFQLVTNAVCFTFAYWIYLYFYL